MGGWLTDEPTYSSERYGGRLGLTYKRSSDRGVDLEPIDYAVRVSYLNESLKYEIDPATLEDLTRFDQLIALGLDPITGSGNGRLAAIDLNLERTAVDRATDDRPQGFWTDAMRVPSSFPRTEVTWCAVRGQGRGRRQGSMRPEVKSVRRTVGAMDPRPG